jgi:hypothetical protein
MLQSFMPLKGRAMKLSLRLVGGFPVFITTFPRKFNPVNLLSCSIMQQPFIHICLSF